MLPKPSPPPLQWLSDERLGNVRLGVKREDLIHPYISGNKWRKLRYNLAEAQRLGFGRLLTFGGAYSNHILATAAAARACGLESIGIIRGEPCEPLNGTLEYAKSQGMQLHYMDRGRYRLKNTPAVLDELQAIHGPCYIVPEGGSNIHAVKGCAELLDDLATTPFDYIATACGTGGTLAGVICGLDGQQRALGIPVLKGASFLYEEVGQLCEQYAGKRYENWSLSLDFHHGGYAKSTPELLAFIDDFQRRHGILIEPVYTGKLFFALYALIQAEYFPENSAIIALHTGGLRPT